MNILDKKLDALMRLCTAEEESDRNRIREEVRCMLEARNVSHFDDPEYWIRQVLLELGAPDHLSGHPYVVQAILLVIQDRIYINHITQLLYPQLALQFNTTPSRVERAIRHLIEVAWSRGDYRVLNRHFGGTVSALKGKPTNGEFIARVANIVLQRMREAA
jgi:two-component system response regulator (stage 0 sporulation protein A)